MGVIVIPSAFVQTELCPSWSTWTHDPWTMPLSIEHAGPSPVTWANEQAANVERRIESVNMSRLGSVLFIVRSKESIVLRAQECSEGEE